MSLAGAVTDLGGEGCSILMAALASATTDEDVAGIINAFSAVVGMDPPRFASSVRLLQERNKMIPSEPEIQGTAFAKVKAAAAKITSKRDELEAVIIARNAAKKPRSHCV